MIKTQQEVPIWNNLSFISVNYSVYYITPPPENKMNNTNDKSNQSGQCAWQPEQMVCTGADDIEVGDESGGVGVGGSGLVWDWVVK